MSLDQIRERLENTPRMIVIPAVVGDSVAAIVEEEDGLDILVQAPGYYPVSVQDGIVQMFAHAVQDRSALLGAVRAVLAIHKPGRWASVDPGCVTCRENGNPLAWPCPTVTAINAALEGK